MAVIKPTIGRVVWYWPSNNDEELGMQVYDHAQPCIGHVACVWSDTRVNLLVIDHQGVTHRRTSVYLKQDESEDAVRPHCTWMPYQKGQAAKTESLEARLTNVPVPAGEGAMIGDSPADAVAAAAGALC